MITSYSSSSETWGPQVDARRDKARDERAFEGHWLRQSQVRKFRSRSIFSVMILTTLILCKGPDRLLPDRDEDEWRPRVPRGAVDHDRDGLDVRWLWREKSSDPNPTYFFVSDHFHHPLVVCVVPCTQPRCARTLLPRGEPRISLKTHRGDFAPHKCKYKLNKIYINSQESFFGPDKQ